MNFVHFFPKHPLEKAESPRISGYPHPVIFRTSGPSRNTHPPFCTKQLPRVPPRVQDLLYFCVFQLPPSPSWTPMETVASWHGEVNYKRYQSLGVVGRLVGLGSTDSQLPLRADPRARAIAPSLSSSPYPSLSLPISLSSSSAPHLTLSISFTAVLLPFLLCRSFVLTSRQWRIKTI